MTTIPSQKIKNRFPPSALAGWFEDRRGKLYPARKFLIRVGVTLVVLVFVSATLHIALDIYGLFRPVAGREIRIYHEERISKYLLMQRYVPANYNGLIIGIGAMAMIVGGVVLVFSFVNLQFGVLFLLSISSLSIPP